MAKPPRRGLLARVNAKWGTAGSTKHTPWQDGDPPKGGGVGPVPPKDGPKPTSGPVGDAKSKPATALGDDALWAWVDRREKARREADAPLKSAPAPVRSRRQDPAGSQWGADGLREDPPPAPAESPPSDAYPYPGRSRPGDWYGGGVSPTPEDIWDEQDRIDRNARGDGGTAMPEPLEFHNARRGPDGEVRPGSDADPHFYWNDPEQQRARRAADDATRHRGAPVGPSRSSHSGGGGTSRARGGGTQMSGMSMRNDWDPRLAAVGDLFREAQAAAASLAADIEDGGSHQAVKDGAAAIAGAAAHLAGTTDDLHATSRTADATAWQFTEEKTPDQAQDWV